MTAAIVALTMVITLGVVACGGNGRSTATSSPMPPSTPELKQAADELFGALSEAAKAQDAAALLSLLPSSVKDICTAEQLQSSLASGDAPFPEVDVKSVFVDLEDQDKALVRVALQADPAEGSLEGLATALVTAFPFPMVKEEGQWKFDIFSFLPSGFLASEERCPFADESVSETAELRAHPDERAVPVEQLRLEPPPGVFARESGSMIGNGEASTSVLLETGMTLDELLEYYRAQVLEPDSTVQQQSVGEDLALLTWTFRDDDNRPVFAALLITSAGDELIQVRMWMAGPGLERPFDIPEAPPIPVPPTPRP